MGKVRGGMMAHDEPVSRTSMGPVCKPTFQSPAQIYLRPSDKWKIVKTKNKTKQKKGLLPELILFSNFNWEL